MGIFKQIIENIDGSCQSNTSFVLIYKLSSRFLILINQDHYYPPAVIIRKNNTYGISELSITSETPPTVVNNVSLKLMTAFFCSITAES